jgi:hypothetical protein
MGQQNSTSPMQGVPEHIHDLRLKSWGLIHEVSGFVVSERLRQLKALLVKYSPGQPRVPAGSRDGGQWTSGGGGGGIQNVQIYDPEKATEVLRRRASKHSRGECAKYVRIAIEAGGVRLPNHPVPAKDYDPYLGRRGFEKLKPTPAPSYLPRKGDIAVFQPYVGGNINGHIAMYDGSQWISDFKQPDFWPGQGYRSHKPPYSIYRHP